MYVRTAALVTNLAVHLKITPENAAVWVSTLNRARPVAKGQCPGVRLHANPCCGKATPTPRAWRVFPCPERTAVRQAGRAERTVCGGAARVMPRVLKTWPLPAAAGIKTWKPGAFRFQHRRMAHRPLVAHSILDRSPAAPGETVSMKHICARAMRAVCMCLSTMPCLTECASATSRASKPYPAADLAAAPCSETRFTLPVNAALGEYSITLVRKGRRVSGAGAGGNPRDDGYQLESSAFRVEEFVLPALFGRSMPRPALAWRPVNCR